MIQVIRRTWLPGVGAVALLRGGYFWAPFRDAVEAAERRVSGRSQTLRTVFGTPEYAAAGSGTPRLLIHGTGGGHDQGLGFGSALLQRGHQVIAPSRFGYLRNDFSFDPSVADQADAIVALPDHLRIGRRPMIGGLAAALSASAFALRHPGRCTALILLVPAATVSGSDPAELSALRQDAVRALLNSDVLYKSALKAVPEGLIGTLLATDPRLLATVSPKERKRAFAIGLGMMPIHARTMGMMNDAGHAGQPANLDFSRLCMPCSSSLRKATDLTPPSPHAKLPRWRLAQN